MNKNPAEEPNPKYFKRPRKLIERLSETKLRIALPCNEQVLMKAKINERTNEPISEYMSESTEIVTKYLLATMSQRIAFFYRFFTILVPIALFTFLGRQNFGTRNEGLWGHGIFKLIRIFFTGLLKQRNLKRK